MSAKEEAKLPDVLHQVVTVGPPIRCLPTTEFRGEKYIFAMLAGGVLRVESREPTPTIPAGTVWYIPPGAWGAKGESGALAAKRKAAKTEAA